MRTGCAEALKIYALGALMSAQINSVNSPIAEKRP